MKRVLGRLFAIAFVMGIVASGVTTWAQSEEAMSMGNLTLGSRFAEDFAEGTVDILIPFYAEGQSVWFINPRGTMGDDSAEEVNLGLGYRYLIPDTKAIVGANMYYDSHWSEHGNQFDQLGFGLELLTEFIDGRVNYYLPENDSEPISSAPAMWGSPFAEGNSILQEYWGLVEKPREGYDAEIGFKIPKIDRFAEVRVFAGYYDFESEFSGGSDIDGVKGRLEVRPCSALTFDAEVYENKDLLGTDYFVGVRMHVPFNLGNLFAGGNPFEGAGEAFRKQPERSFAHRMTEQVIRDQYIRLESGVGGPTREATVADDVMFADNMNGGSDGSAEDPYDSVQEAVNAAEGAGMSNVYVYESDAPYAESVVLPAGLNLWGRVPANGGFIFGPANLEDAPVIDGGLPAEPADQGPSVTMHNNTSVQGLKIRRTYMKDADDDRANLVGIFSEEKTDLLVRDNIIEDSLVGVALIADTLPEFTVSLEDNIVRDNDMVGGVITGSGASGMFNAVVDGSQFINNGGPGLMIDAMNYDSVNIDIMNSVVNENNYGDVPLPVDDDDDDDDYGALDIIVENSGEVDVIIDPTVVSRNGNNGIRFESSGNTDVMLDLMDVTMERNDGHGADIMSLGDESFTMVANNIVARENSDDGMWVDVDSTAVVSLDISNIDATRNDDDGIDISAYYGEDLSLKVNNVVVSGNDDDGLDVGAYYYTGNPGVDVDITNINASQTDEDGMDLRFSQNSMVDVSIDSFVANNNEDDGLELDGSSNDQVTVNVSNGETKNNEAEGIDIGFYSGTTLDLVMDQIVSSNNTYDGIEIYANSFSGEDTVTISLTNLELNDNDYDGLEMSVSSAASTDITIDQVVANKNGDDGIDFGVSGISSPETAVLNISNVTVDGNEDDGLDVSASNITSLEATLQSIVATNSVGYDGVEFSLSNVENADVDITDLVTSINDEQGLDVSVYSSDSVDIDITNAMFSENRGDGVRVSFNGSPDAALSFTNVEARDNLDDGIDIQAGLYSGSSIDLDFDQVVASHNNDTGIEIYTSNYSEIDIDMTNVEASDNLFASGLDVYSDYYGDPAGSNFALNITNGMFNNNGNDGIEMNASTFETVSVGLDTVSANENLSQDDWDTGIHIYADATDTIDVDFVDVTTIDNNAGSGVAMGLYIEGSEAEDLIDVDIDNLVATGNDHDGLDIYGRASSVDVNIAGSEFSGNKESGLNARLFSTMPTTVDLKVRNSVFANNKEYGARVHAKGDTLNLDFGAGAENQGLNSIYGNGMLGLWNDMNGAVIDAEYNWWGTTTPVEGEDYSTDVNADNPLTSDPN